MNARYEPQGGPQALSARSLAHLFPAECSGPIPLRGADRQVASETRGFAWPSTNEAIHAQEDVKEARKKASSVASKLEAMRLKKAAEVVREGVEETLTYYGYPAEHWRRIRTNNPMERIIREIRRRTRVVGHFPDGESMLVAARLRHVARTKWGSRRYLDMELLEQAETVAQAG